MKAETAARLLALNEQFYQTFGPEFSRTRRRLQPGVLRWLDRLRGDESILDLGCGSGGLARELVRRGHRGPYTGLDLSLPLLEAARAGQGHPGVAFLQADLVSPDWDERAAGSPPGRFDWLTAFAVLHHVPGQENRLAILRKARALTSAGGRFIHSEWQFLESSRLRTRIQPWDAAGLSASEVEPGDHLLDWRAGGSGLRYVHHFGEAELEALAAGAGFQVVEAFRSDGENGRLGLYQVWETC